MQRLVTYHFSKKLTPDIDSYCCKRIQLMHVFLVNHFPNTQCTFNHLLIKEKQPIIVRIYASLQTKRQTYPQVL